MNLEIRDRNSFLKKLDEECRAAQKKYEKLRELDGKSWRFNCAFRDLIKLPDEEFLVSQLRRPCRQGEFFERFCFLSNLYKGHRNSSVINNILTYWQDSYDDRLLTQEKYEFFMTARPDDLFSGGKLPRSKRDYTDHDC